MFVYLPYFHRYSPPAKGDDFLSRGQVLRIAGELGIQTIDVHERLGKHPDPTSLYPWRMENFHFSPDGYRLVGEHIAAQLPD